MTLTVVGSGSDGNGYVLQNDTEALIIECGCPFSAVTKALDYNITKIVGAVISHEHGDHAGYIKQYERLYPIFAPALGKGEGHVKYGNFEIWSFPVVHDVDCYGFYIKHPEMGKLIFVTDTQYVRQNFKKLHVNHILVECNYQKAHYEVLSPKSAHVFAGHMSEETAHEFILANLTEDLQNVVAVHLSAQNTDWQEVFANLIKLADGRFNAFVAHGGLQIDITRKVLAENEQLQL